MTASIRFGTDGWRAVIGEQFTVGNVGLVSQALADWLAESGRAGDGVVVGYDTRFLSRRFAVETAAVLAANNIRVMLTDAAAPTPAVSWAIRQHGLGAGVVITASHNPPEYNGFKLKAHYAGPALPAMTAALERHIRRLREGRARIRRVEPGDPEYRRMVTVFNPLPDYWAQLAAYVDMRTVTRSGFKVVVDAMHGAGARCLLDFLRNYDIAVHPVRAEPRPDFGGTPPEPISRNLRPARAAALLHGADVGLCLDGDGDRVAAIDADGAVVDAQRVFALLLQHLHEDRGMDGLVVKTFAGTRMVRRLAEQYRLPYVETPVGFKHVAELALQRPLLIGGEESGGIGVRDHIPERDGILCNLLLLEMMSTRRRSLAELVDDLMAAVGNHVFARADLRLAPNAQATLMSRLAIWEPEHFAGLPVVDIDRLDGVKLDLGEQGWILFRLSGTEPLLRVYVEATTVAIKRLLLEHGAALAAGDAG